MKKSEDFGEWYNEIVELAGLSDKRYPIKGMNVWTPYGWKIMQHIDRYIRHYCDDTDHHEVLFPLLIPENEFSKEKEHIKGFDAEVFWVTHAGLNPLDVKMLLRPTSETAMYPMFSVWIRSHADLPLKIYQIVNVFRYETKMTRAFIRVREIHFFESHTCHADFEDAERQIRENFEITEKLMRHLCLPYKVLKRTEWDKFPGACYTVGIDMLLPSGRSLQLGSIHQYKDNFSRPYEIKYEDEKGEHKYVHQTTFGMSERLIGAVIAVHGDDKGIIMPPDIAPYQIVVVPIPAKGSVEEVYSEAKKLAQELKNNEFRVHLDLRDVRPGNKFYDWEIKGVPLRVELGPRDIANNSCVAVRRDTGEKATIKRSELQDRVNTIIASISESLLEKATKNLENNIVDATSLDNLPEKLIRVGWCGSEECGRKIETTTDRSILGNDVSDASPRKVKCVVCGKDAENVVHLSKPM
ncbi:MAG: proline--tRNA ligase [Thermoplasmata archaeon]|nr:proline--tRNA ligase [Thermoplasmata archaeon]